MSRHNQVAVRGQFIGFGFLFLPCRFWGFNLGYQDFGNKILYSSMLCHQPLPHDDTGFFVCLFCFLWGCFYGLPAPRLSYLELMAAQPLTRCTGKQLEWGPEPLPGLGPKLSFLHRAIACNPGAVPYAGLCGDPYKSLLWTSCLLDRETSPLHRILLVWCF